MSNATHSSPMPTQPSKSKIPSELVAYPSLSRSLCTLSTATSLDTVALHPSPFAQHASQGETKLEVALKQNKQRQQEDTARLQQEQQQKALLLLREREQQQRHNMYLSQPEAPLTIKTRKSKAN